MHGVRTLTGDNNATLRNLTSESVHCVVTSPPYWGQRDYGATEQTGNEQTADEYIANLVTLFAKVRRVLRADGTLWLNLGDKYRDKELLGLPWRVALALRDDGWRLRSELIWHKPNAMTSSALDRPICSHEHLFLLTKSEEYYYDHYAVRQPAAEQGRDRALRSVWTIPVARETESHFAAYPEDLVKPCILAGTSAHGVCQTCGTPWFRELEAVRVATRPGATTKVTGNSDVDGNRDPGRHITEYKPLGWRQGCSCHAACVVPAVVLDPYGGTGTTAAVAVKLGRRAILCELNPAYIEIQKRKIEMAAKNKGFGI